MELSHNAGLGCISGRQMAFHHIFPAPLTQSLECCIRLPFEAFTLQDKEAESMRTVVSFAGILAIAGVIFVSGRAVAVGNQVQARTVAPASMALISSPRDLQAYLAATARSGSPLDQLSPQGRARFLSSLTFNRKGLTGFRYDDLRAELSPSQIYRVLSLFGEERDIASMKGARVLTAEDRAVGPQPQKLQCGQYGCDDSWCSGRATCQHADNFFCTNRC